MSTEATPAISAETPVEAVAAPTTGKSTKRRGNNRQRGRRYVAYPSITMNRRVKKLTELVKSIKQVNRLSSQERDMVAFMCMPLNSPSRDAA